MSQPYLGEIRMFAGNFAPRQNAYCSGQIMNISQNAALFSLFGTYYGGNGQSTFGLPDFRGRLPICFGQGVSLSNYNIGEQVGTEGVNLSTSQLPMHPHMMLASGNNADHPPPTGNMPAALQAPYTGLWVAPGNATPPPIPMNPNSLALTGSNLPHENRMPALAISVIVALVGVFPSRN